MKEDTLRSTPDSTSNNMFGTDGVRGAFGEKLFTVPELYRLGHAIAQWAQEKYRHDPTILIGHDTRVSCPVIKSILKSSLLLYPTTIYDGGVLSSPAVLNIAKQNADFDVGIIISASHNPYQDNGIKIVDPHAGKLSVEDEKRLSDFFNTIKIVEDYNHLGTEIPFSHSHIQYRYSICTQFKDSFLQGKKIVLDAAHGATFKDAPAIFKALGAEVITLHDKPNGLNINKKCGSLHPQALQNSVIAHKADAGFAFDGDGDRVLAVNRYGHIKNGDDILALLSFHPSYIQEKTIVGTVMTNHGFESFLHTHKKELTRAGVGDRNVYASMQQTKSRLGGEQSGHIILSDHGAMGDGVLVALKVLESLVMTNNWDMHTFDKFPQVLLNIPVKEKKDLSSQPLSDIIAASKTELHAGRILVRYSGTEPLLRVMVEDDDSDHAHAIGTKLCKKLEKELT